MTLVRDMWEAMRGEWEMSGRGAVEVAVAERREVLAKGADWHEVARGECDFGGLLDRTTAALGPDGEIVVVPAYFTHKGLLVDLPGVVVVGVRTDTTGAHARPSWTPSEAAPVRSPRSPPPSLWRSPPSATM